MEGMCRITLCVAVALVAVFLIVYGYEEYVFEDCSEDRKDATGVCTDQLEMPEYVMITKILEQRTQNAKEDPNPEESKGKSGNKDNETDEEGSQGVKHTEKQEENVSTTPKTPSKSIDEERGDDTQTPLSDSPANTMEDVTLSTEDKEDFSTDTKVADISSIKSEESSEPELVSLPEAVHRLHTAVDKITSDLSEVGESDNEDTTVQSGKGNGSNQEKTVRQMEKENAQEKQTNGNAEKESTRQTENVNAQETEHTEETGTGETAHEKQTTVETGREEGNEQGPPATLAETFHRLNDVLASAWNGSNYNETQRSPRVTRCGLVPRIIGGVTTSVGMWPWAAIIKDKNGYAFCGGTLVSYRHILTAAHCIADPSLVDRYPLTVTVGEHDLRTSTEGSSQTISVAHALYHQQYAQGSAYNNDIGILVLSMPAQQTPNIGPACLPAANYQLTTNTKVRVVGWGYIMEGGPTSPVLREVELDVLDNTKCLSIYPYTFKADRMICGGYLAGGKDTCDGDSGGPMLQPDPNGRWTVVGVVSYGLRNRCGRAGIPAVYTKVSQYLDLVNMAMTEYP